MGEMRVTDSEAANIYFCSASAPADGFRTNSRKKLTCCMEQQHFGTGRDQGAFKTSQSKWKMGDWHSKKYDIKCEL